MFCKYLNDSALENPVKFDKIRPNALLLAKNAFSWPVFCQFIKQILCRHKTIWWKPHFSKQQCRYTRRCREVLRPVCPAVEIPSYRDAVRPSIDEVHYRVALGGLQKEGVACLLHVNRRGEPTIVPGR